MLGKEFALAALEGAPRAEAAVLEDYVQELSQLYEIPVDEVRQRFERFLDVYHRGTAEGSAEEWAAINTADLEHSFIRISKPYRFRGNQVIPRVCRLAKRELRTGADRPKLLEFGGGGGSDSIAYARSGFDVAYADLVSLRNTEVVRRRFALRGLDIPIYDALALPVLTFDVITAIDVLEHLYDVEETVAQLASRLKPGGLLCCVNAFTAISHDGDHLDKNRVYATFFERLMSAIGFERVAATPPLEAYRRSGDAVADDHLGELTRIRRELYRKTRDEARAQSSRLLASLSGVADVRWEDLPAGAVVESDAMAKATAAARQTVGRRAYTFAASHAPAALKTRVYDRHIREARDDLRNVADSARTLAALSDWTAVLRIAEQRLRSLPAD
jgi:SAM-dependent methyltransferase